MTTVIVIAEIGVLGHGYYTGWTAQRQHDHDMREESRTHEGPLMAGSNDILHEAFLRHLGHLPSLRALNGNGLRFVVMPTFSVRSFALTISIDDESATAASGELIVLDQHRDLLVNRINFAIPAEEYLALVARFDQLTDGWPGDGDDCLDGSPMAFERIRGARVTSGEGNCSPHYAELRRLVLHAVRGHVRNDLLLVRDDWHP